MLSKFNTFSKVIIIYLTAVEASGSLVYKDTNSIPHKKEHTDNSINFFHLPLINKMKLGPLLQKEDSLI